MKLDELNQKRKNKPAKYQPGDFIFSLYNSAIWLVVEVFEPVPNLPGRHERVYLCLRLKTAELCSLSANRMEEKSEKLTRRTVWQQREIYEHRSKSNQV